MKFAFPGVKEGVIIECKIIIVSDFYLKLRDWTFQRDIPVRYSDYRTHIPQFFFYSSNVKNFYLVSVSNEKEYRAAK